MTEEQFIQTPQYKLVQRFLKVKYPWIKSITPSNKFDEYTLVRFVDVIINLKTLMDTYDLDLSTWAKPEYIDRLKLSNIYYTPYLSQLFDIDRTDDDNVMSKLQKQLEGDVKKLVRSSALPEEFKSDKNVTVLGFISDINDVKMTNPN
jgi:hypothetical protein